MTNAMLKEQWDGVKNILVPLLYPGSRKHHAHHRIRCELFNADYTYQLIWDYRNSILFVMSACTKDAVISPSSVTSVGFSRRGKTN